MRLLQNRNEFWRQYLKSIIFIDWFSFFNRYKNYLYIYYGGKGISPVVWNIEVVESSKVDTEEVILETSILNRIKINLN